jgi:hypothetical protein
VGLAEGVISPFESGVLLDSGGSALLKSRSMHNRLRTSVQTIVQSPGHLQVKAPLLEALCRTRVSSHPFQIPL